MLTLRYKAIFLAGALSVLFSGAASATTYTNANKTTSLMLAEKGNNRSGYYFTRASNREFIGIITITSAQGTPGAYYYEGTFGDRAMGTGKTIACSGDITIVRRPVGRTAQLGASVTWKVKGGQNCPSVGKTVKLDLVEPLPRPNQKGDFTPENADTWITETSGVGTWPEWRVISADGELNCRKTPNGAIAHVYLAGKETVVPELRGVNAIKLEGGAPWMQTNKGCYVRANSQYIEPISLPK